MANLNLIFGFLDLVFAFLPYLTVVSFIQLFIWWIFECPVPALAVYFDSSTNHPLQFLWWKREHRVGDDFLVGEDVERDMSTLILNLLWYYRSVIFLCAILIIRKFCLIWVWIFFSPWKQDYVYNKTAW